MDPFTIGIGRFEVELMYLEEHAQFVRTYVLLIGGACYQYW